MYIRVRDHRQGWVARIVSAAAWLLSALSVAWVPQASAITVTDIGAASATTCTLAQAINAANDVNGVTAAADGSATPAGTCVGAFVGPNTITLLAVAPIITLDTIDNHWYGPNALPPIASEITIVGGAAGTTLIASHTGDPTPATANAFRFFYVSGGLELPSGALTLVNVALRGGYAKGGDSGTEGGGGGAGMGGAIFNQGALQLLGVGLIGNSAQGGGQGSGGNLGGGGMGQDGAAQDGGGFGGPIGNISYGGIGSAGAASGIGGGAGGGFITGSDGGVASSGAGAAGGGLGIVGGAGGGGSGNPGGAAGDGGGGGAGSIAGTNGSGGSFGGGGQGETLAGAGGGGVGGGGGTSFGGGGGGGFGGGGGAYNGVGGFGGGAGQRQSQGNGGGFGAGNEPISGEHTGGAGMGGAIFNHGGSVSFLNVTATQNLARGGASPPSCNGVCTGSGLGAVLFNLNGTVTIDFSTLAGNFLARSNARGDGMGREDGTVYSLAYGNDIHTGLATTATLNIHNSIIHGTQSEAAANSDDVIANVVNGSHTNTSSLNYAGKNFVLNSFTVAGIAQSGSSPSTLDPRIGALSVYVTNPNSVLLPLLLPVLPIGADSPATDAASSCALLLGGTDGSDARATTRPQGPQCDVGSFEFDQDYIFANGNDVTL
jgi:hypothetical protein